jgi:hypothetical protein
MVRRHAWLCAFGVSLGLGLGLGLGGCRAKTITNDASTIAQPEPPPMQEAMAVPPGCLEGGQVVLTIEPEHLPLTCKDGFRECSGRATLMAQNCVPRAFGIGGIYLRPTPRFGALPGPKHTVRMEPGDVWSYELELDEVGVYEVSLNPIMLYEHEGPSISPRDVTLTVTNPAREQAEAECRDCNGVWGPQGIRQLEGCNCRTSDGGTPCDDGSDCEAECIEREEGTGFRCSEFALLWGCYWYLPEGWSKTRHRKNMTNHYVCAD